MEQSPGTIRLKRFLRRFFFGSPRLTSPWDSEECICEELFSVEGIEECARSLAASQALLPKAIRGRRLAGRLAENEEVLLDSHRTLAKAIDDGSAPTPAAKWLVENYHLVEKQIHDIRSDLPPRYYRQLPKLADGPLTGLPRVLGVAWDFIAHTDSRFDPEMLCRYVRAYQQVQPLTIGELWALAIALRIVLIENLRRLAEAVVRNRAARQEADALADRLLGAGERAAEPVLAVLAEHERTPLLDAFAVQLVYRLRDQDPGISSALTWLDRRLAGNGTDADAIVHDEHRQQGALSVTVRNIITSMRRISDVDWTKLVERVSLVDEVLGAAGIYSDMDFPTRDLYRSAIEELARRSDHSEIDIAGRAVKEAQSFMGAERVTDGRHGDAGFHLLAGGRRAFEAKLGYRPPMRTWLMSLNRVFGIRGYVAAVGIVATLLLAGPLLLIAANGLGVGGLFLLGILGAIPAIDVAMALVNRGATWGFGAALLPAMALRDGIPPHLRTLVVVPTLLTTVEAIDEHIERLEVHYLSSPEGDLYFALLSDWVDAKTERAGDDDALLAAAVAGIAALNRRHGSVPGGGKRFLLLHRRRIWSEGEGRWLGWERKRGKLHELNRLLRGATDTTFVPLDELPPTVPPDVRYVVTLDADTRLPRDTVRRLIGKMAHPLNRPRFDAVVGRVVEGYAVMQPRVAPSLPTGREGSLFQRTFSSTSGIDPYASAISDVYQDLFGEGSYVGKGIYDVDAFELALADRVPDSTLLSHDLFEGIFARAGLASDIKVVEEFPSRYDVDALRHHRWARGDWQLLPWILGRGPAACSAGARCMIPAIGRWKMLDNLRRTLSAPATVLALLGGWTLPFNAALAWTLFVLSTIVLPTMISVLGVIVPHRTGITHRSHLGALGGDFRMALTQSFLQFAFVAHQAWLMGDAIGRTLVRLFITRRHLLEWVTAAQATIGPRLDLFGSYRRMAGALYIGLLAFVAGWLAAGDVWFLAAACAVLWIASPALARWASLSPLVAGRMPMTVADARALRLTACRTWRYFDTFVTPADNMLPPDNFQEDPEPKLAHRTSPTNLGLYLLAVAAARDFGWVGTIEAVERLETTIATMHDLERFRGHFFNWYDTRDLRPLDPRYISAVDSGNLAGHLITLANALREWRRSPVTDVRRFTGIADAADVAREAASDLDVGLRMQTATRPQLDGALAALAGEAARAPLDGEDVADRLSELADQAETMADIARALVSEREDDIGAGVRSWVAATQHSIESHRRDSRGSEDFDRTLSVRLNALEDAVRGMALAMEFGFLFDRERKLLSIGYLVTEEKLDPNCYDLLASEARLASFVAIAKGDVSVRHWFRLGRAVTPVGRGAALVSWSGSMFEYLMPSLVMRGPAGSLLEQTSRLIVWRQIDYGKTLGLPWGISESAYNARDLEYTYQYSNFGVPGLGLKRGLGENAVVAPYATALAAMVDPSAATRNLERLAEVGARGQYGFYESLDFTLARVPEDGGVAIVRAFMAHHQGMTIVAIANALLDGVMRARFHAEPMVKATELLLQERTPRDVAVARRLAEEAKSTSNILDVAAPGGRRVADGEGATPGTHLLSNGQYSVMLTAAGSGYSRWRDIQVTRWREDATCDDWGSYIFLRDVDGGQVWSASLQPIGAGAEHCAVAFEEGRAEFIRRDHTLTTSLDVLVSAEDAAEVRQVSISNSGKRMREIEITSYAELVLAPQQADIAHPAFSKLFVETDYLADSGVVLATRRRRASNDPEIWAAHLAIVDGESVGKPEIETDRARFLGRGCGVRSSSAVVGGRPLSNTVGIVLDPVFAIRRRIRVAPGAIVRVAFWTMVASTREAVLRLADRHRDISAFERAATLAWTQAQVQNHHLGIGPGEADVFQRLAGHLLYAAPTLRPASNTIRRGCGKQSGLWPHGISGDLPIVLLRIAETDDLDVVRQLLRAHEYWRMKLLAVDLVILNERASSYVQDLQNALEAQVRAGQSQPTVPTESAPGRVFILRADLIPAETSALLASVARVVLVGHRGSISDQLDQAPEWVPSTRLLRTRAPVASEPWSASTPPNLELFNGLGGFADGGREYVTILGPGQATPAPWINVVANPEFGFQVAAEGTGFTWSINSRENQITPWSNDPVTDRPGEAFYLRDEETGEFWTPTAAPIRDESATYIARHGRGYSRFEHSSHGISANLLQFVPLGDPIKISRIVLNNTSGRARQLSVTAYAEWILGSSRAASAPFVVTEIDARTGAMFAKNPWHTAFGSRVAFIDCGGRRTEWTGDRREFIGRNGGLANPAALASAAPLSNTVGAGLDPCGVLRTAIELPANGAAELVFFLGEGASAEDASALIERYRATDLDVVRAEVDRYWDDILGAVQVKTPDRAMDIMLNGWLLYQTIACRFWARSAFYQASGAYGFRDQLQDAMAFAALCPGMAREHLLRASARQFVEGDVQHWWLPHSGQGVRTRISDDRIWLAYAVAHYVDAVGDAKVLDEAVPFLEGQKLVLGEHDVFFLPIISDDVATLYEHCARGLDHALGLGDHGLPLIGTGDWNDGMNRVGEDGRGESVWLGWFLHAALTAFACHADTRRETVRAATWRTHADGLRAALEGEAWDGDWYRRGFFDDGSALGSAESEECRIDSIAQSWAVLSGVAKSARARRAMASVEQDLIRSEEKLALLFAPPFDTTPLDPGYIKGYPPGIRENGGQYTHAALWSVMAFAALGEGDKAVGLFSLLNPINHARTRTDVQTYKVEPYVVAADVYATSPHVGRGGWTWYTGSAGWMQRAGVESILGLSLHGEVMHLDPCISKSWAGFEISLRHGSARYEIRVENPAGVERGIALAIVDEKVVKKRPFRVRLKDDGATHYVQLRLGGRPAGR